MGRKRREEIEVFFSHILSLDGCWQWGGYVQNAGYASFSTSRETILAHRWSYRYFVGKIKAKMTLDHLCRNKLCVNPDHLEQITRTQNIQRAGLAGVALHESKKLYCSKGHSYQEHGVRYKNGHTAYGTPKYARRCTVCEPKYLRYGDK